VLIWCIPSQLEEYPRVILRKTQTAEYWQNLSLTPDDLEYLRGLLLEAEGPLTTRQLALALVTERCREEEDSLRAGLAQGTLYQPKKSFHVGEKVIFPALDFRSGRVVSSRPGQNPEYGAFEVVTVDFGPDRRQRSFAAGLAGPHKLNADLPDQLAAVDLLSPERLLSTAASTLPEWLAARLSETEGFAGFEDRWFPRDLLADVHVGHLNIAEALIEVRQAPVSSDVLLKEIDLPAEVRPETALFSLESALASDGRFDQVGWDELHRWYLRRLEPEEALDIPEALRVSPFDFDRNAIAPELRQIEWELDDEWSDETLAEMSAARASVPAATLLLTYPHLISGTLPLNSRSRPLFALGRAERTIITLIDGRWGQRFLGWVVKSGRYVAGLRPWFEQHKLPAGAFIIVERRDDSGEVVVDFRPKRMRREWTRWAQVVDNDRLDIQLRKQEVACEYDDLVIIGDDRPSELLRLRQVPTYAQASLADLVHQIFTDLAGLSQQGTVHAKTLYGTVNVLRRCPPGPIFYVLSTDSRFESAGDGYYRLSISAG
jgi:hypothetical protein